VYNFTLSDYIPRATNILSLEGQTKTLLNTYISFLPFGKLCHDLVFWLFDIKILVFNLMNRDRVLDICKLRLPLIFFVE
jgi:hypothetical protein